jgi:hypothetical protein
MWNVSQYKLQKTDEYLQFGLCDYLQVNTFSLVMSSLAVFIRILLYYCFCVLYSL